MLRSKSMIATLLLVGATPNVSHVVTLHWDAAAPAPLRLLQHERGKFAILCCAQ